MLNFLADFKKRKKIRKALSAFCDEIDRNLDLYYVMQQRGTFRLFRLECLDETKRYLGAEIDGEILNYIDVIEDFNKGVDDLSGFKQWYLSDINNKTKENASILHVKREKMIEGYKEADQVFKSAQKILKVRLRELKTMGN